MNNQDAFFQQYMEGLGQQPQKKSYNQSWGGTFQEAGDDATLAFKKGLTPWTIRKADLKQMLSNEVANNFFNALFGGGGGNAPQYQAQTYASPEFRSTQQTQLPTAFDIMAQRQGQY